jgi:hypothetical protein
MEECEWCGEEFDPTETGSNFFCSDSCKRRAQRADNGEHSDYIDD